MVQFIPSAPGTTPWAPQRPSILEQIGPALSQFGQAMGAPDANGNTQGIASILQAIHGQKTLNDIIGMGKPNSPIVGPRGYVPPGAGADAVPAGSTPPRPQSPFGAMGDIPLNRLKQLNDITGKTGVSSILNNANATTLYMSPDGSLSMTQTPGSIPIGGYKGPAAASAVVHSKHEALMNEHMALTDRLKEAAADTSLSKEDKLILSIMRSNAMALQNPVADFSDDDLAQMRDTFKKGNAILAKSAGVGTGKGSSLKIDGTTKKRVKVKGPNNQTGTIEEGDELPAGWSLASGR